MEEPDDLPSWGELIAAIADDVPLHGDVTVSPVFIVAVTNPCEAYRLFWGNHRVCMHAVCFDRNHLVYHLRSPQELACVRDQLLDMAARERYGDGPQTPPHHVASEEIPYSNEPWGSVIARLAGLPRGILHRFRRGKK